MFDFFKRNKADQSLDVKGLRDAVLQLIKEELQQLDGGEGAQVKALQLFVNVTEEELHLYEAALYTASPEKLQEEVQRIADNFALNLPAEWQLEIKFAEEISAGAIQRKGLPVGLRIQNAIATSVQTSAVAVQAVIKVLKGKAEREEYIIPAESRRINIGREANVQANDGSFRINEIAFPGDAENESNKYISRQHAHLEWDNLAACFKLYADEGGVPPGNKTKIRSAKDETLHKLNSTQIGYQLRSGDQIILGDAAVLDFTIF